MSNKTVIPKGSHDAPGPCWIPRRILPDDTLVFTTGPEGRYIKPSIKCQCGSVCNIGLHHVHADGIVTNSFFDSQADHFFHNGKRYTHAPGCGWHVWLKLADYDCGDFPPVP